MLASSRLAVLCLLLILSAASGQDSLRRADVVVRQIEIQSRWGGLGRPSKTELLIRNENGVYLLDGSVVETSSVDTFISAVLEPPIPKPSAVNLGLTKNWLEATSDGIVKNAKEREEQDSTYWAIGGGTVERQPRRLFLRRRTPTWTSSLRCCPTCSAVATRTTFRVRA